MSFNSDSLKILSYLLCLLSNCSLLTDGSFTLRCLLLHEASCRSVDAKILFFCVLVFLSWPLLHDATLGSRSPLKQQARFIHAEDSRAKKTQVALLTEEVRILECSVDGQRSLEDSFLKMSTRHAGVPEERSENIRSAPTEDEGEVRREERPLSSSPLTSQVLLPGFHETLLLDNTLLRTFSPDQELQQWSDYADERGDFSSPQKANLHHLAHLLHREEPPADLTAVTHQDVLEMSQDPCAQLRPEATVTAASAPDGVKTASVLPVPSEEIPPLEAKPLAGWSGDQSAQRNHFSEVPKEKKPAFSLEALQIEDTPRTEQKLESSEKVCSSTATAAVAALPSGDQRRGGGTLDTKGQSLREGPQSGLSCSGSSH